MSVETGREVETGVAWSSSLTGTAGTLTSSGTLAGSPVDGSRGFLGLSARRRVAAAGIAEVRGPAACMARDALFRRMLLVADVMAIVGAFVLTVELSSKSVQLTWAAAAGVPILIVCAKLTGLYDRDETL